jgi:hypothetical protein
MNIKHGTLVTLVAMLFGACIRTGVGHVALGDETAPGEGAEQPTEGASSESGSRSDGMDVCTRDEWWEGMRTTYYGQVYRNADLYAQVCEFVQSVVPDDELHTQDPNDYAYPCGATRQRLFETSMMIVKRLIADAAVLPPDSSTCPALTDAVRDATLPLLELNNAAGLANCGILAESADAQCAWKEKWFAINTELVAKDADPARLCWRKYVLDINAERRTAEGCTSFLNREEIEP